MDNLYENKVPGDPRDVAAGLEAEMELAKKRREELRASLKDLSVEELGKQLAVKGINPETEEVLQSLLREKTAGK